MKSISEEHSQFDGERHLLVQENHSILIEVILKALKEKLTSSLKLVQNYQQQLLQLNQEKVLYRSFCRI